jgi:hypothetical protein
MFEATYITDNPNYENFYRATNPAIMGPLLEQGLKKFWGDGYVLDKLRIPRVFPHKKGGLVVQYELTTANIPSISGQTVFLCGRLFEPGAPVNEYSAKFNNGFIQVDDLGLVIPVFPNDNKLPVLIDINKIFESQDLLNSICEKLNLKPPISCSTNYEVIGYRFERRAILKVHVDITDKNNQKHKLDLIAKIFKPTSSKQAFNAFRLLANNGFDINSKDGLTVPEIYHFDEKTGIMLTEYFNGTSPRSLPEKDIFNKACSAAGKTLRKLHDVEKPDLSFYSSLNEIETLKSKYGFLSKIFPSVIDDFKFAVETLEKTRKFDNNKILAVCSHRDYYDKQFLYKNNRSVIIDCDNLALADPALDYGNFTAHLELRKLQHSSKADLIDSGRKSFERSYENKTNNDFYQRAVWWEAASLIRLSMLYLLRPAWSDISPYILQKAFALIK